MTRRELLRRAALGAAAVGLGRSVPVSGGAARRPLRVGASLSLSGVWADDGHRVLLGYRLWAEQVNEAGGLLGEHPVELVVLDDASTAEGSARRYQELLDDHRVDLVLGPYGSVPTSGAIEVLEARGVPCAMPIAASPALWARPRRWCVQVTPSAARYMDGPLTLAFERGARRLAALYLDTGFTRDVAVGMIDKARAMGMTVVARASYPDEASADYEQLVREGTAASPDILAGGGYLDSAVRLTRAARRLGVEANMLLWMEGPHRFPWGWVMGAEGDGVTSAGLWSPLLPTPEARAFAEAFRSRYALQRPDGGAAFLDESLNHESASGYAAALITQRAVEAAGGLDRRRVRDALFSLRLQTPYGPYAVDDRGAQVGKPVLGTQWVGGTQRLIWPPEVATGEFLYPLPRWSERL